VEHIRFGGKNRVRNSANYVFAVAKLKSLQMITRVVASKITSLESSEEKGGAKEPL